MEIQNSISTFCNDRKRLCVLVYREMSRSTHTNFLMSPFSLEIALAFLYLGAKDETAEEISVLLGYQPNCEDLIKTTLKTVRSELENSQANRFCMRMLKKSYIKESCDYNDVIKSVAEDFNITLEKINFGQPTEATKIINEACENYSAFKNLINPDILNEQSSAILVDFTHFSYVWYKQFNRFFTMKKPFYTTYEDFILVDTMHTTSLYNYHESAQLKAQFLEMRFEGHEASMVVVLPHEKDGLPSVENRIDVVLNTVEFTYAVVTVALPKFKMANKMKLKEILRKLGVVKAFTRSEADLSGVAGEKGDLWLEEILQESHFEVNEKGVEAIVSNNVPNSTNVVSQSRPVIFAADHSFLFYIKAKGFVVYMGRVVDPVY